jgi:hypothetical protein
MALPISSGFLGEATGMALQKDETPPAFNQTTLWFSGFARQSRHRDTKTQRLHREKDFKLSHYDLFCKAGQD